MTKRRTNPRGSVSREPGTLGVFVSWSGDTSRRIAEAIGGWVPNVFQHVHTFVSSNDIDAGSNWFGRISEELAATNFGVLCLTGNNLATEWIHFEAGAISKQVSERERVIPYLHGISPSDVGPLLNLLTNPNLMRYSRIRSLCEQNGFTGAH
jgi:hypothetical protein